jgi:signal transduction histidine kinase
VDRQWRFTYINERALRYKQAFKNDSELTREELLGKDVWEVYRELVGTTIYHKYHEVMREHKTVKFETRSAVTDRWIELHAYPTGEGISVFFQDITERKLAELELERRTHQQAVVAEMDLRALANNGLQSLMYDSVALVAQTTRRRHSGAHNVRVGMGITEEKLWAEVQDDRRGFDATQQEEYSEQALSASGGLRIRGMIERARALGGDLEIESDPETGTRVRFEVDLTLKREEPEEVEGRVRVLLVVPGRNA